MTTRPRHRKERTLPEIQLQADVGLFWYSQIGRQYTTSWESSYRLRVTSVEAERAHVSRDGTGFCLDLVIGVRYGELGQEQESEVVVELKPSVESAYSAVCQLNLYRARLEDIKPMDREFVVCYAPQGEPLREGTALTNTGLVLDAEIALCTAARLAGQTTWRWPMKAWGRRLAAGYKPELPMTLCRHESLSKWPPTSTDISGFLNFTSDDTDRNKWRGAIDKLHELYWWDRPIAACLHDLMLQSMIGVELYDGTPLPVWDAANV